MRKDPFGKSLYTLYQCMDHVVMFLPEVASFASPLPMTIPTSTTLHYHSVHLTTTQSDPTNNTPLPAPPLSSRSLLSPACSDQQGHCSDQHWSVLAFLFLQPNWLERGSAMAHSDLFSTDQSAQCYQFTQHWVTESNFSTEWCWTELSYTSVKYSNGVLLLNIYICTHQGLNSQSVGRSHLTKNPQYPTAPCYFILHKQVSTI